MNQLSNEKNAFKPGVTVVMFTLNNADCVGESLQSAVANQPGQILVVDGGSEDKTVEIAKQHTSDVYVAERGFYNQAQVAFQHIQYDHVVTIECDHVFPKGFVEALLKEFKSHDFFGMQGTLDCLYEDNYFEQGMSVFYQIHQQKKGEREIIAGPAIYTSQDFIHNVFIEGINGYSIDTEIAETRKQQQLKVGLAHSTAYQNQRLTLSSMIRKYANYGKGDYEFYTRHAPEWTAKRKLQSLTHVLRQYGVKYPWQAVKMGKAQYVPYFWLSAGIRYAAWAQQSVTKAIKSEA